MPYLKPKKVKGGFVLPKKGGGFHKSKTGKVVKFKTAAAAEKAAQYINALEHGFKPTAKKKTKSSKKKVNKRKK